jgi:hypothetical protein
MQKWRNLEVAGEADWLVALKRESVIGPLAAQSRPGVQRVGEAARELGLVQSYGTRSQPVTAAGVDVLDRVSVRVKGHSQLVVIMIVAVQRNQMHIRDSATTCRGYTARDPISSVRESPNIV